MKKEVLIALENICGSDYVLSDFAQLESYLHDETEQAQKWEPNSDCLVVKPATTEEVSKILAYANEHKLPVIARGGGTGLCGAAMPTMPSIIVSMERMNKIVELDSDNLVVTVEAGVTLEQLMHELSETSSLFFPVHPGDEGAQIGGMVAENAGGVGAVKFGIMRNHIKGLKVVFANGEVAQLGGKLLKNNMGLDLLHAIIGSEGTLAFITEVTLKLYPKSNASATLIVSFDDPYSACAVVPQILQAGILPQAIEYMDRDVALYAAEHIGQAYSPSKGSVDIMIIMSEKDEDTMYAILEEIVEICEAGGAVDSIIAESSKEQRSLLEVRSNVYTAYKEDIIDALDMAVPPASVPQFMADVNAIAAKYGTTAPGVGHIGDGNIHHFILKVDGKKPDYVDDFRNEMYDTALKFGGTITAEHGTGKTRKKHMSQQFGETEIQIMRRIKLAFDPQGILNPDTIV